MQRYMYAKVYVCKEPYVKTPKNRVGVSVSAPPPYEKKSVSGSGRLTSNTRIAPTVLLSDIFHIFTKIFKYEKFKFKRQYLPTQW